MFGEFQGGFPVSELGGLPGTPYGFCGTHIFRDSNMGVGLGKSMGPFRGPMSLGVPENPTHTHTHTHWENPQILSPVYVAIFQAIQGATTLDNPGLSTNPGFHEMDTSCIYTPKN